MADYFRIEFSNASSDGAVRAKELVYFITGGGQSGNGNPLTDRGTM